MGDHGGAAYVMFALGFIAISGVVYFIPWLVALMRKHPQLRAIFWVNLLLGWSGIGWVFTLAWAFLKPRPMPDAATPETGWRRET